MIDKIVNVNIGDNSAPVVIPCTEGDTMWRWHFRLFWQSERWTIPSGSVVKFAGLKADRNVFDVLGSLSGNEAVVNCDAQITAAPGACGAVVTVIDTSGKIVATAPVLLAIKPNPQTAGPMSETVLSAYNDVLQLLGGAVSVPASVSDWLAEHITQPTDLALDTSLSVTGAAADANAAGKAYKNVLFQMEDYGFNNLVNNISVPSSSGGGVTMEQVGNRFSFNGVSSSVVNKILYTGAMPDWIEVDKTYRVIFEPANQHLRLQIYSYDSENNVHTCYNTTTSGEFSIPSSHSSTLLIRFRIDAANVTISETVSLAITESYTEKMIREKLDLLAPASLISSKWLLINGAVFITVCGNSIFIDADDARFINKETGTVTSYISDTFTIANGTNNPTFRTVNFDGESFTRQSTFSAETVAWVYNYEAHAVADGIVTNYRKLQDGYIRSGSEFCINFARIPYGGLASYYNTDGGVKVSKKGFIYTTPQTVLCDINDGTIAMTLRENTVNLSGKRLLAIGDSFIARGHILNYLGTFVPTLQFCGTKRTSNYDIACEGVSGSRLYYFTDPATSPFWFNGSLDFGQYLSSNGVLPPDYILINSAINHTSYTNSTYGTYIDNLNALVEMIKAYSSSIKIYVTFGPNFAVDPASDNLYPAKRWGEVRKCQNSVYSVDGIVVIPADFALIDELDYPTDTYDYYGTDIPVLSDNVHPTEPGWQKLAKMIYNYLGV